jgi:hypothetical protein
MRKALLNSLQIFNKKPTISEEMGKERWGEGEMGRVTFDPATGL